MVTILITTYNCGEYIANAVQSALNQDFKDYEILIIDDGSEDSTAEIISSFHCHSIRYIKINHSGRAPALNIGLMNAAYDWILLLDADDIISPVKLSRLASYIKCETNLVITSWTAVFSGNNILYTIKYPVDHYSLQKYLLVHSFNNSVFFNKNFILSEGGYSHDLNNAEDYDLWLRLYNKAEFKALPEFLTFHRYSITSLSRKEFSKTRQQINLIQDRNKISSLECNISENSSKADIHIRRIFFFGGDILQAIIYWKTYKLKYLFLLFLSLLPEYFLNRIKISNVKMRINYLFKYYSSESVKLRTNFNKI